MDLVLEIEHLLGVAFAAYSPADSMPDWPPQPDRVFSALVAAWGARGEQSDERRALEWLEAQPVPEINASNGFPRTAAIVFVPPNDPQSGRVPNRAVMPDFRSRQPRRFPTFRPHDPRVQLVWRDIHIDDAILTRLNMLAAHISYVGHSASLTRCRFRTNDVPDDTIRAKRRVYKGRLAELEQTYAAGRRPRPGTGVRPAPPAIADPARSVFSDRWLALDHVDGKMPDLRVSALVAKALRDALMSGYKRNGQAHTIPSAVSGHAPDGSPMAEPHLAIAPLAFLDAQYADGHVLGFAIIPPGNGELLDDSEFQRAVRSVTLWNEEQGRRELKLHGFDLTFSLASDDMRRSIDPRPYVFAARTWTTCTPIVLDRHLKARGNAEREAEIVELVRQACVNIGLPPPVRIAPAKHAALKGAPSAYPSGRGPRWMGWRLPKSLASRQLVHATLQFDKPVRGPVVIGAGRFAGMGLCRALDPEKS